MTSNADNAKLAWPGDGVFDNPWAGTFSTRDDHRVSKTLLDTLNALSDPRMKIFAQPTKSDPTKYVGLQNGLDNVTRDAVLQHDVAHRRHLLSGHHDVRHVRHGGRQDRRRRTS